MRLSLGLIACFAAACAPALEPASPVAPAPVMLVPSPPAAPSPIAVPPQPDPPFASGPFGVAVRQDGREVAIANHEVTLQRRAFEVVVLMRDEPRQVLLNASFDGRWFDRVARGLALDQLDVFQPGRGMAESVPPDPELMLSDEASHFLFVASDTDHRCHAVQRVAAALACFRNVASLTQDPGHGSVPIERTTARTLYLSFMQVRSGPAIEQQAEVHRDWVRIKFD